MKPFDLEKAKAGAPIQTRGGRLAKFIAYVPEARASQQLIILIDDEVVRTYANGFTHDDPASTSHCDIVMAPVKREGWVNVYSFADSGSIPFGGVDPC